MGKLIRGGATGSANKLMTRILERSELAAAVRELSAPLLGQLIDHVGLEDAGELVALASTQQLASVWDRDLWTRDDLDAPERFDPDRFALWLAVLLETGEQQLVERLRAQPIDLLTLALHRLVRVVDQVQWSRMFAHELEDEEAGGLSAPWHELVLIARDAQAWDAVLAALLALDEHDHALLRELLERCCDLDFEGSELDSDEVGERSEDAVLERDVAAERDARQAISGYVTASDARAFLRLASEPVVGPAAQLRRDAITNAYFREVGVGEAAAPRDVQPESASTEVVLRAAEDRAGLGELIALLAESGVTAASSDFVHAELTAGAEPEPARAHEPPMSLLQSALAQLQRQAPQQWDQRMAELAYLANVLFADARPGTLEPRQALERASEVCNSGLVAQLPQAQPESVPHAVALLHAVSADRLFRAGYARVLTEIQGSGAEDG
jgi:hypothetical protein